MIDGSSFLGLFTLELIGQAFFRSAGKGIRISLPASPVNQAHVAPPPKSPASGCRISHAVSFGRGGANLDSAMFISSPTPSPIASITVSPAIMPKPTPSV